jgi:hypothetical protein
MDKRKLSQGAGAMKSALLLVLGGIIGALVVLGTGRFLVSLFPIQPPEVRVASTQSIVRDVRSLGVLTSLRFQMAKAEVSANVRYGVGGICNISAKHVMQAFIEAGVDLSAVEEGDVVFDSQNDLYRITLPAPQLTNCSIDPIATQQYQVTGASPVCPVDTDELRRLASYKAIYEFRDEAIEGGILEQAQRQSALILGTFVRSLTGKETVIEFEPSTETIFPRSCAPAPPPLWVYDPETNMFSRDSR